MSAPYRITRRVTRKECWWLGKDDVFEPGTIVYRFHGNTYGTVRDGMAFTREPGKNPFYELPRDAVEPAV